ncbi:MAG: SRPBCC family protein [Candidatus Obscuribacterales bacterium]|nr:SRPBCC family protein [Candidatus Obscuribacterales bacterium]
MEGIIAVGGFWLCMIIIAVKKPLMAYIEKTKMQPFKETEVLAERVQQLERLVSTMNTQLLETRETNEFTQKLLIESAERLAQAQQLLIESQSAQTVITVETPSSSNKSPKMIESDPEESSYGKVINEHAIRFERTLPAGISEVWKYFTEPDLLPKWLATASLEPRLGGRVELNFDQLKVDGQSEKSSRIIGLINGFEPERKLAFSWMDTSNDLDSAVSIEMNFEGGQTSLVLTHSRLPQERMHEFMAAWHAHLDVLAARLKNIVPPDFSRRFKQVAGKYAAIVASTIIVAGASGVSSMPAQAATNLDQNSYQSIKTERSALLKRYDLLWRDVDEHQKRVDFLKRDKSLEAQREVDQLDRQLEDEYKDLHQLETEIKDLEKVLN